MNLELLTADFLATTVREPLIPLWLMELLAGLFLYAWLFCVGACVGSFLNVVVYRLPRGLSLVYPPSSCPKCGHGIRLRDNIPILSWLFLRGRCRDCASPITPRYLFVELAVASVFLAVALVETRLTGEFPRRNWDATRWLVSPVDTFPFWSAYTLDVVVLTTLFGAALIDVNHFRTPARLFIPVVVLSLTLAVVWPLLDGSRGLVRGAQTTASEGVFEWMFGWLIGAAAAALFWVAWSWSTWRGAPRFAPAGLFIAVGVVAGWEALTLAAAAATALLAVAIVLLRIMHARFVVPLAGILFWTAVPALLDLDVRLSVPPLWTANYHWIVLGTGFSAIGVFAFVAGILAPTQYFAPPSLEIVGDQASAPQ